MKILLATDGSEYSYKAAKFLTNLDLSPVDEIIINHVISEVPFREDQASYYASLKQIKQEIAPRIIESSINILRSVDAKISTAVIDDFPDRGILSTAEDLNVDLIVMGARGLKGFKSLLIGSVTRAVAINATKSVLVIKPPVRRTSGYLKILFATDGSEYATDVEDFLTTIPFPKDTEICILHVIQSGLDIPERFHIEIDKSIRKIADEIRARAKIQSEKIIKQAQTCLKERFEKISSVIKEGDPTLEILDTAKTFETDIIAVGSKGMRGIKGMLGSVSRYVLGHSACSVLIGKAGKK